MKPHPRILLLFVLVLPLVSCQNREAYQLLGQASRLERAGRLREAVALCDRAVEISGSDPYLLTEAGLVNLKAGRVEAALEYLAMARGMAPSYIRALRGLAAASAALGDTQTAVDALGRLRDLATGDPETNLEVGRLYRSLGRSELALEAFERALGSSPNLWQVQAEIGLAYYERRDFSRAAEAYRRALTLNPWDSRTMNNLAWMYAEQGILLEDALGLSVRSLEITPDQPIYLDTLAEIYYRLGDRQLAVSLIRRAIAIDPQTDQYRNHLQKYLSALEGA